MNSPTGTPSGTTRRPHFLKALPWLWLGLSAAWAVVIFVTDQPAWPLAIWIATTLGTLTLLRNRLNPTDQPASGANT